MSVFFYIEEPGLHFECGWCGEIIHKRYLGDYRDDQPICGWCIAQEANIQIVEI